MKSKIKATNKIKKRIICTFLVASMTMSLIGGILPANADTLKLQAQTLNAGSTDMAVIKSDGSLWAWGANKSGQLGDGTNTNRYTPKKVMDNIVAVSAGGSYTAVIKIDGSLWT